MYFKFTIIKNILLASLVTIPFSSGNCKKEVNNHSIVSIQVKIAYKNKFGDDLLDITKQNHFSPDSIRVYNVINGIKNERYYRNLDNPRLLSIFKKSSHTYILRVGLEVETTLLELNKNTIDTITCVFDKSNGNKIVKKVWYNGVLKWDSLQPVACEFLIVK